MAERSGPAGGWLVLRLVLFVGALAILLSLGTWQVQRLHWKESLIAERAAKMKAPPMDVGGIINQMTASMPPDEPPFQVEFQPVMATGHFDHEREVYFLATEDGRPGFYIYTPFRLETGGTVLVNRGFVPEELRDPARRKAGMVAGTVTISGLAREVLYAKPGFLVPDNDPARKLFFWKDIKAMAAAAGLEKDTILPFFIDEGRRPQATDWPRGGATIIDLPNNHLQYALTWYALALALLGVGAVSVYRRRRRTES